jgi:hypothetical protein
MIGIIILQCRSIPSHHIVYLKYIQFCFSKSLSKSGEEDIIYKVQESQVERKGWTSINITSNSTEPKIQLCYQL